MSGSRYRWRWLLGGAAVVTCWAVWQAADLELDTDIQSMLPHSPAAEDYRSFLETFGGVEKVFVLVTADDAGEASADLLVTAAELLATTLRAADSVASVRAGLDSADEALFVEQIIPRALLFAEPEQRAAMLRRLEPEAVRARVAALRARLSSPTSLWDKPLLVADPLGLHETLDWRALGGQALRLVDPASGAFLSADGSAALLIVTPRSTEIDTAAGRTLQADLEQAYAATSAALDRPVELHALGGPLYAVQDERILRADLRSTVLTSALGVAVLLFLYFGGLRTPAALALSVAVGVLWTAALVSALWGRLSVLGLAFASMLLGLGVDYGIHGGVRFHHWRGGGLDPQPAVRRSIADTRPAILASAGTTMAAFLVLSAARFPPLRELGIAVALGILMTLAAALAVGASWLAASPAAPTRTAAGSRLARWIDAAVGGLNGALHGKERRTLVVAAVITAGAAFGLGGLRAEADLQAFRPSNHPAKKAEGLLADQFAVGVDTMTILVEGPDLDSALEGGRRVANLVRQRLGSAASVASPSDWLLPDRRVRDSVRAWTGVAPIAAAAEFRAAATAVGLSLQPFERSLALLEQVGAGRIPAPVPATSWPSWLTETIRAGQERTSVAVFVRAAEGALEPASALALARRVKAAEPGAAVASAALVGEELRRSVLSDLARLGTWCGLAIVAGVLLSFRGRALDGLLALLPVTLGAVWTLGLFGWMGIPLDPFSAMMTPLILGIGVDDGLHALHGKRAHGDLRRALLAVGPSIALTTLTTCVGFGSLLASSLPALRRAGALVALGTLLCLAATLVVLPAAARLTRRST